LASVLAAMVSWDLAGIKGIGWRWTSAIWVYNIAVYLLLDPIKFAVRYGLSGRAWGLVIDHKVAFTSRKGFGKEAREAAWAHEQRTLHGLGGTRTPPPPSVVIRGAAGPDGGGCPAARRDRAAPGAAHPQGQGGVGGEAQRPRPK